MARLTADERFHGRLRQYRQQREMSLEDVVFELRGHPAGVRCSIAKLSRLERSIPEAKADVVLVVVLADIYGVEVSKISALIAEEAKSVRDLLERSLRCSTVLAA